MSNKICIDEIHDKNINFLIGSGASYGLFPTLALKIKNSDDQNSDDQKYTIETLAIQFDKENKKHAKVLLFMHYFQECIKPVLSLNLDELVNPTHIEVINNYKTFLETIIHILGIKKMFCRRCNIFTTNYDGCLVLTADKILKENNIEFIINDGTRGFSNKYLQAKNFNSFICQTGIFEQHYTDIPQLNLINLHGSAYWKKDGENIIVNYQLENLTDLISHDIITKVSNFSKILDNPKKSLNDIHDFIDNNLDQSIFNDTVIDNFWNKYNQLPIVNPTTWKFYETVFEEHYYQMLRALSYELEKPNTIFITFGFSFTDTHILNLCKRSLSNPSLQLFICCFDSTEVDIMKNKFAGHKNVEFISINDSQLNFVEFNNSVFTINT